MKLSNVMLLAVVVILAGMGQGCEKGVYGTALYTEGPYNTEGDPVDTGTRLTASCSGNVVHGQVGLDGNFYLDVSEMRRLCTFGGIGIPDVRGGTRTYDCFDGCTFEVPIDEAGTIADLWFGYNCMDIPDCDLWCANTGECPGDLCAACITDCETDRCP